MLFIIIPLSLIGVGVVLAGRVIYKKIPKDIGAWNETIAHENFGPAFYEKALVSFSLKSKQIVLNVSTKLVYKLKITSLKTDNFFTRLLNEIRDQKTSIQDAAEVSGQKKEEDRAPKNNFFKTQLTSVSYEEGIVSLRKPEPPFGVKKEKPKMEMEPQSTFEKQEQQLINQLSYNPKDVSAYKRLGWLYLENSKPIEARQAFKMSVKLGSRDKVIVTKLLEMGGVVHKEGTAPYQIVHEPKVVLANSLSSEFKTAKPKTRKIKVRKV